MNLSLDDVGSFVALGGTFQSHNEEKGATYRWPDLWIVPDAAIIPEGEPIKLHDKTESVKPGSELSAVIGESIHKAGEKDAWDAIKGFTVSNDVTASGDWPGWSDPDHANITGVGYKILPTYRPVLSEYVAKKSMSHYADLDVLVTVDGEVSVSGSTAELSFSIPELIAFASQVTPLKENDIVALGDPGNASLYLDTASRVTCSIESIGELTNPIEKS